MSATEVLAQIQSLPHPAKSRLFRSVAEQTDWLEDIIDAAIAESRMDEPERPIEQLLAKHGLKA